MKLDCLDVADDKTATGGSRSGMMAKQKSMILTPKKKLMTALLRCFLFFEGFCHNGWNHVNNVYYVILIGWSPFKASWVWFARDVVRVLTLAPAGAMIDKTTHKKGILIFIALQKIVGGLIMVHTDNFVAHVIKGASDGLAEAFIAPTVLAMTLGVVGKTRFHKKALAYNEMIKNSGTVLSIIIFGVLSYSLYPRVREVFYQYIGVGIALIIIVALMPDETNDVVDHNRAAGKSILLNPISSIADLFDFEEDDSDDEKDIFEDDPKEGKGIGKPTSLQKAAVEDIKKATGLSGAESQQYTKTMSLREMYSDPVRGRSLLFLSLVICTYHLVNATILPLTGQFVGLDVENRSGMSVFMIFMLIKVGSELLSQWFIVGRMELWGYRNCMILACVLLGFRCALFAIVSNFTDTLWILGIVHATQGPPVALENLTKRLYVHILSRKTGRYNLNFGIIETFKVVGSASSILIGGALATQFSYHVAFSVLAGMCIIPIVLVFGVNDVSLTSPVIVNTDDAEKLG